jgi:hypothetical protein
MRKGRFIGVEVPVQYSSRGLSRGVAERSVAKSLLPVVL